MQTLLEICGLVKMKKIIISLSVVAAVAAAVVVGTTAFFSDTETSPGNTISAGTIDISVDGENPWQKTYLTDLPDFKPGVVKEITFTVKNEGANPIVLRKGLKNFASSTGVQSEPECTAEQGVWNNAQKTCTGMTAENNDLSKVVVYDMTVTPEGGSPIVVIPESWNVKLADVNNLWMPLGTLDAGKTLVVKQSYRLASTAGNEFQGDKMTFDISLYAEQLGGPGPNTLTGVILENKDANWYSIMDNIWGILTWDSSGNYTMRAFGLDNSLTYHVAYYNGSTETAIDGVTGMPSGTNLTLTGTYAGFNTNVGAKYWLKPNTGGNAKVLWEGNVVHQ